MTIVVSSLSLFVILGTSLSIYGFTRKRNTSESKADNSSSSPLTVRSHAFRNDASIPDGRKIQKIILHGFKEDELNLASDDKSEDIQVVFLKQ